MSVQFSNISPCDTINDPKLQKETNKCHGQSKGNVFWGLQIKYIGYIHAYIVGYLHRHTK